ncbi:DUF4328 domain-containing protein [Micromonospora foliorum]|uniref:DUF4328 domain-containing protein n=1 Tax=Micromonospora foliorum TaxID=2911210 RepID=UPI001EE952E6|nr:DUF4328 domain-containing protein [Micromonospora foliorum]MCG5437885.1 DUF4328 domain-containing protein [Micromonospora foliorum]
MSPENDYCLRCFTPLGQPAVTPGLPTYRVRGIGLAANVAVGATAVLYLAVALSSLVGMVLARRARANDDPDLLIGAGIIVAVVALIMTVVHLTAAVLVIIWTWRARKNTDAFPGAEPAFGPGWAIAGWLVPFANFVVPARVVAGVARDSLWRRATPALVAVWWCSWLVFSIGERLASRADDRAYEKLAEIPLNDAGYQAYSDLYQDSLLRTTLPALGCVIAAVTLILLIQRISAAQEARIASATRQWPTAPVWPAQTWPAAPPAQSAPAAQPALEVPGVAPAS